MKTVNDFLEHIKGEETAVLATASGGMVTMRTVSPVCTEDAVLIFTSPQSCKYRQLKENPNCCLSAGGYYLQARAEFAGPTMKEDNASLRELYNAKFPGAFDADMDFGGRDSDFILFKPVALSGWSYESGRPVPVSLIF